MADRIWRTAMVSGECRHCEVHRLYGCEQLLCRACSWMRRYTCGCTSAFESRGSMGSQQLTDQLIPLTFTGAIGNPAVSGNDQSMTGVVECTVSAAAVKWFARDETSDRCGAETGACRTKGRVGVKWTSIEAGNQLQGTNSKILYGSACLISPAQSERLT